MPGAAAEREAVNTHPQHTDTPQRTLTPSVSDSVALFGSRVVTAAVHPKAKYVAGSAEVHEVELAVRVCRVPHCVAHCQCESECRSGRLVSGEALIIYICICTTLKTAHLGRVSTHSHNGAPWPCCAPRASVYHYGASVFARPAPTDTEPVSVRASWDDDIGPPPSRTSVA